jgi:HAD superfamily, subfamily IIIB (Acid phosphatase)
VTKLRERLPVRRAVLSAVSVLALGGLVSGGSLGAADATDHSRAVPAPPAAPTSADQIQNLDQVRTAIKGYYGDTVVGADHLPSPTGAYAHEVAGIEAQAKHYLTVRLLTEHRHGPKPAIILDVDDTSLNTYNYEIFSSFVFNPATNADFVNGQRFIEVFGMPALANWANAHGITVFFLTGRNHTQRDGTAGNLQKVGFTVPVDEAHLYLKYVAADPSFPDYLPCAPTCTTTDYKSLTRQHIESLGYDIVANFGDQFSDLNGGFADRVFKMPNPMYFLP